jgi:hypothetical protein
MKVIFVGNLYCEEFFIILNGLIEWQLLDADDSPALW